MKIRDARLQRLSDFYCTYCGHKSFPILRRVGKEREPGHLKKLYCLYCKEERNMAEVRNNGKDTLDDFLFEYENVNFVDGHRVVKSYKQFISETKREKEKEGEVFVR